MANKIFRSIVVVAAVVLLCSLAVVLGVLYNHFTGVQIQQLKDELSLAVTGTEQYGNAFLENVDPIRFRLTWIDKDGTVLYDTHADQTAMENHANREEFIEALETGQGSSSRPSPTLAERTFYEARRLQDGTVLRISAGQASVWSLMPGILFPVFQIALLALGLSSLLAHHLARKITQPINEMDLRQPLTKNIYPELAPLTRRISEQNRQIRQQIDDLRRKTEEYQLITENMQEGLLLLDREASVISLNPSAAKMLGTDENTRGCSLFSLAPDQTLRSAISQAMDNGFATARVHLNERDFQFDASRVRANGETLGAVVLVFDITETLSGEKMRREFSANVSHELKTPLQGIMGSAELLENGLVQPEDVPRFMGHIRKEAARLVALIEDIIRLSQLDEQTALPTEEVDMMALAKEVLATLESAAREQNVTLILNGKGFALTGVPRPLYEIIYNLCDNAIRYNKPGGSVTLWIQDGTLQVRDTGIGIPQAHQSRIFERFYRVDKSHSKQSGGTGLGLSIVKHAAAYHNAQLTVDSQPDAGTTVTLTF